MTTPENWLLLTRLRLVLARLELADDAAETASIWREADRAVADAGAGEDAVIALPVLERSLAELTALFTAWDMHETPLCAWDQAVLKRAMNAFKKRLKVTRGDDEVSSNRNPMSRGVSSSIVGIRPPEQYSADIWETLVAQGRLRDAGDDLLEPAGAAGPD